MSLVDLFYLGKNIYWVTSTAGQMIPNSVWCAYHVYKVSDSIYTNTTYVAGKAYKLYYGKLPKKEFQIIMVKEEDDFVIIDI